MESKILEYLQNTHKEPKNQSCLAIYISKNWEVINLSACPCVPSRRLRNAVGEGLQVSEHL